MGADGEGVLSHADAAGPRAGPVRSVKPHRGLCGMILAAALCLSYGAPAPVHGATADTSEAAGTWYQDARFGMFIHWGVYSVPARGEWVMEHEQIPVREYEKFAPQFNPTQFSARAIVAIAKRAGIKYITITSKHHDGFAMWATRQSRWDILDATPYKQDPLKLLAEVARRQGVKIFFY